MTDSRTFAASAVALGIVALVHAGLTWPPAAVAAFFGGGALVAFVGEVVAVGLGWLEHHVGPKLLGVPLYVLLGWTATVYVAFRVALLVTGDPGPGAVVLAALLATAYDLLTDHRGVAEGLWTYTDDLPGPRYRGVPWWNFAGWFVVSSVTAALALPFL